MDDEFQEARLEYLFGFPFLMSYRDPDTLIQYGAIIESLSKGTDLFAHGSPLDSQLTDDSMIAALQKSTKALIDGFTRICLHTLCSLITELP